MGRKRSKRREGKNKKYQDEEGEQVILHRLGDVGIRRLGCSTYDVIGKKGRVTQSEDIKEGKSYKRYT